MNNSYWHQKASPWVSISVLVGGLVAAGILFFLYKIDNDLQIMSLSNQSKISQIEGN